MGKVLRYALIGLAVLALLAGAAIAFIAATFDPNQYKPQIVAAVKERTGRTLSLEGDIALSFFPTLGARVGKASLSERGSDREFAGVDEAVVAVKLLPLLSREVIVDAVELKGLRAHLVRDKAGKTNIDDLAGAPAPARPDKAEPAKAAPVKVDIAHVVLENANVSYTDAAAGTRYAVSKFNLKTGRIAPGVPTDVRLAGLVSSDRPRAELDVSLKARITFDPEKQIYRGDDLEFTGKGSLPGVTNLNASARGSVEARLASGEFNLSGVSASATGRQEGGDLNVKIDAPKLVLTREKVAGDKVTLDATVSEAKRKLVARVEIPGVQGTFADFRTGAINAGIELQDGARSVKGKVAGALAGNLEARRFELPQFSANLTLTDPATGPRPLEVALAGAARADAAKQTAGLEFSGTLDASKIAGKATVTRFSPLALAFNVEADQVDVDRYLAAGGAPTGAEAKGSGSKGGEAVKGSAKGAAPPGKIDLSGLKGLDVNGNVKVGSLKVKNVRSSNVRATLRIAGGRLDVSPLTAQLYQGTLEGSLSAQAAESPVFAVKQKLAGVNVGPLLKDAADLDTLEGRGNVTLDLTTRGATVDALKRALNGTAAVNIQDGSLRGINLGEILRNVKNTVRTVRGQQVQQTARTEKTDFSEMKATFNVKDGVAHNNDLALKSPALRASGDGKVDIGNDAIDYNLRATLAATSTGQGGREAADTRSVTVPVRIVGPLAAPRYEVDYSAVATELLKQQILKPQEGTTLKDQVRGLREMFRR